jgi:hypothetical protein
VEFADFSRQVLQVPVQTATVDTASVALGSQDVITMFHVLEHVPDPRRVLTRVREWMAPDGFLVVEVPNVQSLVQAPAHRFHFAHLHSFSAATLGALGESVGLAVVRAEASPDGGNVTCVFRRVEPLGAPVELPENVARTAGVLRGHTSLRHYLSATPYRRAAARLRRRWREDRLLGRLRTVDQLLRWAGDLGSARPSCR